MKRAISRKNFIQIAPKFLKSSLGWLLEPVPIAWLLGNRFRRHYHYIERSQWWTIRESKKYQLEKLQGLLQLAWEKTTYYRRLFNEVGFHPSHLCSLEQIQELPIIDRQIITDNLFDMCTLDPSSLGVDEISTGGTGGSPVRFYINSSRSAVEYAYLISSWGRVGYQLEMPMVVFRDRVVPLNRYGIYYEYDPIFRHHYYSSFHMSDDNMKRYIEHLETIGPCFMHVYPSTIVALTRFLNRSGLCAPSNIQGIIAESEIVYPEQREMVQKVFKCRLFSDYGQSEKVVLAAGCEYSDDYHIWPTYGYCELLDEHDKPVTTPGQRGQIVGTGFINTVMPLIRYRTGDWATYVGNRCEACGREHLIIRDIRGHRTQEMLVASDGSNIPWTSLNMHDDTFARVRQFQFRQEVPGEAVLCVVPADGYSEIDDRRIQERLGQKLDKRLTFTVKRVEAIPLSMRGKAIYVDQRI